MKVQSNNIAPYDNEVAFQGTVTLGSNQITGAISTQFIERGDFITNVNFLPGTYVTDISDGVIRVSSNSGGNGIGVTIYAEGRFNGLHMKKYVRNTGQGCQEILWKIVGAVKESIEVSTDGYLHLVGDQSAPGNNMAYATTGAGVKGWRSIGSLFGGAVNHNSSATPVTIPANPSVVVGNSLSLASGTYILLVSAKVVRVNDGQVFVDFKNAGVSFFSTGFELDTNSAMNENFSVCALYQSGSAITLDIEYSGLAGVVQTSGLRNRTLVAIKIA